MAPSSTPASTCGHQSGIVLTADGLGISLHVDGLNSREVRTLAGALLLKADQLTPAADEGIRALELPLCAINEARGTSWTVQALADECGVDLREATSADVSTMAEYIGRRIMGGVA